jgi:hypothetical protein
VKKAEAQFKADEGEETEIGRVCYADRVEQAKCRSETWHFKDMLTQISGQLDKLNAAMADYARQVSKKFTEIDCQIARLEAAVPDKPEPIAETSQEITPAKRQGRAKKNTPRPEPHRKP